MQSRYYDPELGRFINADALLLTGFGLVGFNQFVYCINNPIRYHDVCGDIPEEDCVGGDPEETLFPDKDALGPPPTNSISPGSNSCNSASQPTPTNGAHMSTSNALTAAESFLGPGYVQAESGRFTSMDGTRQVRFLDSDLATYNNHAGAPHMNFEIWRADPFRAGRMELINNIHVYLME